MVTRFRPSIIWVWNFLCWLFYLTKCAIFWLQCRIVRSVTFNLNTTRSSSLTSLWPSSWSNSMSYNVIWSDCSLALSFSMYYYILADERFTSIKLLLRKSNCCYFSLGGRFDFYRCALFILILLCAKIWCQDMRVYGFLSSILLISSRSSKERIYPFLFFCFSTS